MRSRWTLLVLSWIPLLLWANAAAAGEPFDVFRGDSRPPDVLEAEGGFLPSINPAPTDLYSLAKHLDYYKGPYGRVVTPYISTTKDLTTALQYSQKRAASTTGFTYVYRISTTPHIFDAAQSLSLFRHQEMAKEVSEYDAVGGILWQQVRGYYKIPLGASEEAINNILADPEKIFNTNAQYDIRFDKYYASSGQPQLDGSHGENTYENAREFMSRPGVGDVVGWQGDFPLFKDPLYDQRAIKEKESAEAAKDATTQASAASKEAKEALEAVKKTKDAITALAEADKAVKAAKLSVQSAKKVATIAQEHINIKTDTYNEAKQSAMQAREAAAEAIKEANYKAAQSYVREATNLAKTKTPESARQAIQKVRQIADLKTTIKARIIALSLTMDEVRQALDQEREKWAMVTSDNVPRQIPSEDSILASNREYYDMALDSEFKVLQHEHDKLRVAMEDLLRLEAKAEAATKTSRQILEKEKPATAHGDMDTAGKAVGGVAAGIGAVAGSAGLTKAAGSVGADIADRVPLVGAGAGERTPVAPAEVDSVLADIKNQVAVEAAPAPPSEPPSRSVACATLGKREICLDVEDESSLRPGEEGGKGKTKSPVEKAKPIEMTPARQSELMALAETISEKEFNSIAKKNGLQAVVERRWKTTLPEARVKVLGYQKMSLHVSPVTAQRLGVSVKVGTGALAAVGVGLYVKGVVDAFTTETTKWEKTAAVTAIVPFVGCVTNLVAQTEKENAEANAALIGVDTSLCLLGDMLLLGGWTAPLGIIVHLIRYLIQFFEAPPSLPSYKEVTEMRDKPWRSFLDEHLTRNIASKSWRDKLEGALTVHALEIWSQACDRVGILKAGSQLISDAAEGMSQTHHVRRDGDLETNADTDLSQIQAEIEPAIAKIWQEADDSIVSLQRQYLLSLPKSLRDDLEVSITATAKDYNEKFIVQLNSEDTIRKYPGYSKAIAWLYTEKTVYSDSRSQMEKFGNQLRDDLPPLPSYFTLAYFVGVAAGVEDPPPPKIDPHGGPGFAKFMPAEPEEWKCVVNSTTIDPARYYREKTGGDNQRVLVQQTVDVVYHLLGKLEESRLSTEIPGLTDAREFQMLLAMYIGNTFADWKETQGNRVGYIHDDYVHDMPAFINRVYDIPVSVAAEHILNL